TASGARQALEALCGQRFDAVLCDILIGHPDGFALCRQIKADVGLARMPVILVSAHYEPTAAGDLARNVGAFALVTRTPDFHDEIEALYRALEGAPSGTRPATMDRSPPEHDIGARDYEEHLRVQARKLVELANRTESAEKRYRALFENATDTI